MRKVQQVTNRIYNYYATESHMLLKNYIEFNIGGGKGGTTFNIYQSCDTFLHTPTHTHTHLLYLILAVKWYAISSQQSFDNFLSV